MTFDAESLLKPLSGPSPAGRPLRGITYREIEAALKEDLSGAAAGGVLVRAQPRLAAELAIKTLATESKDLDVAVLLTECLVRMDGFDGLRRGFDLIRELLANFWDTIYPLVEIEDEDEELRLAPIKRLTGSSFRNSLCQIAITNAGYTELDRQILQNIPTLEEAAADSEVKGRLRSTAEAQKRVLPEQFAKSLAETGPGFYEQMGRDISAARHSLSLLEEECRSRFTTPLVLEDAEMQFTAIRGVFGSYEALVEERGGVKAVVPETTITPAPVAVAVPEAAAQTALPVEPDPPSPDPVTEAPAGEPDLRHLVLAAARKLRHQNPADPLGFIWSRSYHFAAVEGLEGLDEHLPVCPPAELRTELWRLYQYRNWRELLLCAEDAMELECSRNWLDLHYYSGIALEQLDGDHEHARTLTTGLLRLYLTLIPDLPVRQLADGTPAASPETVRWLERLMSANGESHMVELQAPEPSTGVGPAFVQPQPNDFFEEAVRLAESGRLGPALESFYSGPEPEHTAKSRFEASVRVAQLCIAARENALAIPILRELRDEIDRRRLQDWDPDLAAKVLAMLHQTLRAAGDAGTEAGEVYSRICVLDPLLALKIGDRL